MDKGKLTAQIRTYALELGADLVGVANIERWEHAPEKMRPQGMMPKAKSVIVVAIHHPDACVELGGEPTIHDLGPYMVQMTLNYKLDYITFKISKFLESMNGDALPIPVSNVWRYRGYKGLPTQFAPDISHIHAAVAAGLGEFGVNGLLLTPEFGPRQRVSSVITNINLDPTPLYNGSTLCDKCGSCIKACPTKALSKEIKGKSKVQIEDKTYKYLNKNKWRCSWAEHFALDLDLSIPDKVTDKVIMDTIEKYGVKSGEVGACLRYCLPPHLRYRDTEYSRVYRRKRPIVPNKENLNSGNRVFTQKVEAILEQNKVDYTKILSLKQLKDLGINAKDFLPDASSVILCGMECFGRDEKELSGDNKKTHVKKRHFLDVSATPSNVMQRKLQFIELDVCRYLESLGYSVIILTKFPTEKLVHKLTKNYKNINKERIVREFVTILTSATLVPSNLPKLVFNQEVVPMKKSKESFTKELREYAQERGADLFGIASVKRFNLLLPQIKKEIEQGNDYFIAEDTGGMNGPFIPKIDKKKIIPKSPHDYLPEAKSVIVLGIHYPDSCMDLAAKPPQDAMGPYIYAQYSTTQMLCYLALDIVKFLGEQGYKAVYTLDLCGTASVVNNPRRNIPEARANCYAAIAAGLGELGLNGAVLTPDYGLRQRFISIVTNAPLISNKLYAGPNLCPEDCTKCIEACPLVAMDKKNIVTFSIEGKLFRHARISQLRCDWGKRYGLVGELGPEFMGSHTNILPPENITEKELGDALRQLDPIQKRHLGILEKCLSVCPYHGKHKKGI